MKITKSDLQKIIKAEVTKSLKTLAYTKEELEKLNTGYLNSQEWKEIEKLVETTYNQFINTKTKIKEFYRKLPFSKYNQLSGNRQPKIIMKMGHYEGDITPSMLRSLVKDVDEAKGFLRDAPENKELQKIFE